MQDRKEQVKVEVATLVKKFQRDKNRQQSEADVRAGYIDLLFASLGWNVYNDPGKQTNYWREGYIRGAGFVDVGMEIAGQPVLFLEAKRFALIPESAKRTGDRTPEEKQAFRYTRGRKIQYAILTNFERLHLFNADHERLIAAFDSPEEYLQRFEELWRLTPEEVSGGSLGWWEGQLEKKDVDLEFLKLLRTWRLTLANAIFEHNAHNPELQRNGAFDFDKLMEAVQRILDRLILVRYGDDKEVLLAHDLLENTLDEYRRRGAYASKDYLMRAFVDISHMMDEHHNTTLFAPDHLCEKVVISNEVLANVLEELSRISFRKFTSDILGNTYESYLGTKLKLVNGQIQDEERTDIRKGQGIYYTPSWVVEYIVDKTLGERLRELEKEHGLHAIEKVRGLAVLDPACGSGSFLIKAYHVLADFYRRMNLGIVQEQTKLAEGFASADMFERLEKLSHLPQQVLDYPQVILQEHLYGVDLDPEAAEIATVNLTMQAFADSRQKKLPKILNENIKVGNSLISGTEEELKPYFGEVWAEKRPFNWDEEFPVVMQRGGFDVVIGNPPWVSLKGKFGNDIASQPELDYLTKTYSGDTYRPNMYEYFVKKAIKLVRQGGFQSFIVPDRLGFNEQFSELRSQLISSGRLVSLLYKAKFPKVRADTLIYVFVPKVEALGNVVEVGEFDGPRVKIPQQSFATFQDCQFLPITPLIQELYFGSPKLDPLSKVVTSAVGFIAKPATITDHRISSQQAPVLRGRNVFRYLSNGQSFFHFTKDNLAGGTQDIEKLGAHSKILMRKTGIPILATLDTTGSYPEQSLYFLFDAKDNLELAYLLSIVNSTLFQYVYRHWMVTNRDATPQLKKIHLDQFPVRRIDFGNATDKAMHDGLVALVERMLQLQERLKPLRGTGLTEEHDLLREVEQVDSDIDNLVYDLYGLTEAERRLVEGG